MEKIDLKSDESKEFKTHERVAAHCSHSEELSSYGFDHCLDKSVTDFSRQVTPRLCQTDEMSKP